MENNENKAKKQRIIIAALILGMMFCIGITIWAVFFRKPETKSLVPDYAPQQTEQYAEPLEDNSRSLDVPSAVSNKITSSSNMPLSPSTFDAKFNCALIAEFEWFVTVISLGSSHQHADSVV